MVETGVVNIHKYIHKLRVDKVANIRIMVEVNTVIPLPVVLLSQH